MKYEPKETTLERWAKKPAMRKAIEKERSDLLLSELVLALMEQDNKSVRTLAAELGVSKTVVQNLRSGTQSDMKLSNFVKLTHAYGYQLVLEKPGSRLSF